MKTLVLVAMALWSGSLLAHPVIRQPDGARVVPAQTDARGPQAKLACDLYEIEVKDGNLGKSRHLLKQESEPFKIGTFLMFGAQFPAPYEKVGVALNHFMVSYLELPEQTSSPYIQAFYTLNGSPLKDSRFELKNLSSGDKVILRDTLYFSDSVLLSFHCGIELL